MGEISFFKKKLSISNDDDNNNYGNDEIMLQDSK